MNRKKHLLIGPLVFLLALSAVFQIRTGVSAASEYEAEDLFRENGMAMDVTYGYDGNAKGGRYIPVDVLLSNDGEKDFSGEVQILTMESDYEIYRYDYPVEVPAGSDGDLHVYIPLGNRADQMFVTLLDQEKESLGHKRVKLNFSLDVPELFIGVLSDTPEKLESWDGVGVDYSMLRTRTVNFDTDTFPSDEMGLDMIDVLLISNYRIRDLSEEQSRVLVDWVRRGGTMILGTGMRVDDTLGRFAPELLEESYEAPQVRTVSFGMQYASDNPSDAELEVPCVDFALSGGNILMSDEERTLLASVTYSQGTIAVAAFDFTDIEAFCRTSPAFLDDLLTAVLGEETISSLAEAAYSGNSDAYWSIRSMINTGNVRRLPSLGFYVLEIVIYVLLAGLVLYVFLRQRELTGLYRSGVAALSLLFTAIIYFMGSQTRFTDTFYTYARFLETAWDSVSETTYMNMRAPYNQPYRSYLAAEYSVKPVTRSYYDENGTLPRFTGEEEYRIAIDHREDKTVISAQEVPAFDSRYFELSRVTDNEAQEGFDGEIEIDRGTIRGTVINQFGQDMENCAVLFYDKVIFLGDMKAGESRTLDGLEALEYPRNHSYPVASWISGEAGFETSDISDEAYLDAVEKTNLLVFYLDHYMPAYSPNAKVVGVSAAETDGEQIFLQTDMADGRTVAASRITVYSSDDQVVYRPALLQQPAVLEGDYDYRSNSLFGVEPVTLEYALGNDVRIERLDLDYVSDEFTGSGSGLVSFTGSLYFYNHSTGRFDLMDLVKTSYDAAELAPYLSPGNTLTVKYVYENMSGYSWDVLLPMLNIVGREF